MQADGVVQAALFCCLLFAYSIWDIRKRIGPDTLNVLIFCTGLPTFTPDKLAGILAALPLLIAALIREDGMGGGDIKLTAAAGMSEGEFRSRVGLALREKRDAAVEALRKKYASRLGTLEDRERRALQKVEKEKAQASDKTLSTALSVGGSLLGALFGGGRRGSAISKASSAARRVSGASKERADVAHAEADVEAIRNQLEALNAELAAEVARLESEFDPATIAVETARVKPRKADIAVEDMALVWVP